MANSDFAGWLLEQLRQRNMIQADLARAAGLSTGGISLLISRGSAPDPPTAVAIARAFQLPPETVFRRAGLLPPITAEVEGQEALLYLYQQANEQTRADILRLARYMFGVQNEQEGKARRVE